jgi:hypothetical protein
MGNEQTFILLSSKAFFFSAAALAAAGFNPNLECIGAFVFGISGLNTVLVTKPVGDTTTDS